MSFTKHSPPTATTNQHQPPNQQIKHPTSTNQHHPTNKSTTQPTSTNITQQTNQQPFSTKNNKKTDSFPSLFQRIPRYQGVGPKHAKIQKSDHLTRSESVIGWIDGWEGGKLPPSNWDGSRLKTNKPYERLGDIFHQPWIYYIIYNCRLDVGDVFICSDFLMVFKWDHPDVRDICWIFIFNWRWDVVSVWSDRCSFWCVWNWDVFGMNVSFLRTVSFVCVRWNYLYKF